jgi:GTP cyclohydrolase II
VLHWLGITRIDHLVSMSNLKYDAMVRSGIEVVERVQIPADRIPEDARVEMDAKKAAGYYSETVPSETELAAIQGRALEDYGAP